MIWHGIVLVIGLLFTGALLIGGPALYRAMGVSGLSLTAALSYSNIVFMTSPLIWTVAMLSASLRGVSDTRTPARITLSGVTGVDLRMGPIPSFGVAGVGLAILTYYLLVTLFFRFRYVYCLLLEGCVPM